MIINTLGEGLFEVTFYPNSRRSSRTPSQCHVSSEAVPIQTKILNPVTKMSHLMSGISVVMEGQFFQTQTASLSSRSGTFPTHSKPPVGRHRGVPLWVATGRA